MALNDHPSPLQFYEYCGIRRDDALVDGKDETAPAVGMTWRRGAIAHWFAKNPAPGLFALNPIQLPRALQELAEAQEDIKTGRKTFSDFPEFPSCGVPVSKLGSKHKQSLLASGMAGPRNSF